jgi:hypothetical protein
MSERRMAVSIAARLARVDDTGPVICRNCGNRNDRARRFCTRCATELAPAKDPRPKDQRPIPTRSPGNDASDRNTCGTCGAHVDPGETFCLNCGAFMDRSPDPPFEPPATPNFDPNIMYSTAIPQEPPKPKIRPSLRTQPFAYVPTSTIAVFLPIWGALVLLDAGGTALGQPAKLAVALVTALVAGLAVWRGGYRRARSEATRGRNPVAGITPVRVLRIGACEVTAASVAAFAWATAAPSSWAGFTSPALPLVAVIATTIAIAVIAGAVAPLEDEP